MIGFLIALLSGALMSVQGVSFVSGGVVGCRERFDIDAYEGGTEIRAAGRRHWRRYYLDCD